MKDLMRKETPDDWGIKDLQNVILNIGYDLDAFCKENGIKYYLMGGSALGAIRHKGFIPWDDDMDVFMTPDNYEKFRNCFNRTGNKEKYYLQELGASKGKVISAKLRFNHSYYGEEIVEDWKIHKGVFIDIFLLHTCPDCGILRVWQYLWAKYLVIKGLANKEYKRHGSATYYLLKLMKILPKRFLLNFGLNQVYAFRHQESLKLCHFLGKARYKKGLYKREHFKNVLRVDFETIEMNVFSGVEAYLTERFGNYMQIPSSDQIRYEQHAYKWEIGEQFSYQDKSDEKYLF